MSDSTVRQAAQEDQQNTQSRIEALRAEIVEHEAHLTQVAAFLESYDTYLANAAPVDSRVPVWAN